MAVETKDKLANLEIVKMVKNRIDDKAANLNDDISEINEKLPFALGIDANNNYGYVPVGGTNVVPFGSGGSGSIEIKSVAVDRQDVNPSTIVAGKDGTAKIKLILRRLVNSSFAATTYTIKKNNTVIKTETISGNAGTYTRDLEVDVISTDVLSFGSSEASYMSVFAAMYVEESGSGSSGSGGEPVYNAVLDRLQEVESESEETKEYAESHYNYVLSRLIAKQDLLRSGTNIKTINGKSILGSGNINIDGSGSTSYFDMDLDIDSEGEYENTLHITYASESSVEEATGTFVDEHITTKTYVDNSTSTVIDKIYRLNKVKLTENQNGTLDVQYNKGFTNGSASEPAVTYVVPEKSYVDDVTSQLIARIEALEYVPMAIETLTVSPSTIEYGTASAISFTYKFSKKPVSYQYKVDNYTWIVVTGSNISVESTVTIPDAVFSSTTNMTLYLEATDEKGNKATKTATIYVKKKIFYGVYEDVSDYTTLFAKLTGIFATSSSMSSKNVNATTGKYIYFLTPFNDNPKFILGGFNTDFEYLGAVTKKYVGAYGVYRSTRSGLGSTTLEVK